jgi:hypothetical protein
MIVICQSDLTLSDLMGWCQFCQTFFSVIAAEANKLKCLSKFFQVSLLFANKGGLPVLIVNIRPRKPYIRARLSTADLLVLLAYGWNGLPGTNPQPYKLFFLCQSSLTFVCKARANLSRTLYTYSSSVESPGLTPKVILHLNCLFLCQSSKTFVGKARAYLSGTFYSYSPSVQAPDITPNIRLDCKCLRGTYKA